MEKDNFEKRTDTAEWLEFNEKRCQYEIERELAFYDIQLPDCSSEIKDIFNDTVELELAECESGEEKTKGVRVRRDGTGRFTSIKNIRFCLWESIERIFNLVCQIDNGVLLYLTAAHFLYMFIKEIGIELDKKQVAVIVALYQETRQCEVTDENLEKVISRWLAQEGYRQMGIEEIQVEIIQLTKWGIIEIADGRYLIAEKIY